MEEIGDVAHLEVKINGLDESPEGVDVEPIDSRVRQPRPRQRRLIRGDSPPTPPPSGRGEHVLLPQHRRVRRRGSRRPANEAEGGHDGLELVVGHNGLEGAGVPEGELAHRALHVVLRHRLRERERKGE